MARQLSLMRERSIECVDGLCELWPEFIPQQRASSLLGVLKQALNWRQETLTIFGKQVLAPRLSVWMGDSGLVYTYSNMTMAPEPWIDPIAELKKEIEYVVNDAFNSVLINFYRHGQDSNGWHADNEPELGPKPTVASLSLGATRDFKIKHKTDPLRKHTISLTNGSLLYMRKGMQTDYLHQIPKRAHAEERINLTFRNVLRPQ